MPNPYNCSSSVKCTIECVFTVNCVSDISTAQNLELLNNAHDPVSVHSLFGVLNHTKTPGGGMCIFLFTLVSEEC